MKKTTFIIVALLLSMACTLTSPQNQNHMAMEEVREPQVTEAQPSNTPDGRPATLTASPSTTPHPNCKVDAIYLNVRACKGIECPATDYLEQDSSVVILAREDNWLQVELASGKTGWINAAYCTETSP